MPKTDIDYSNTIFYKIYCKDETNKALYIGHTTNFVQRKHAHKNSCNNSKTPNHSQKVYQYIRECGGWDNWTMEIIAFHNCENSYEARKIEQEYYEKLGATLNSIQPLPPRKKPKIKTNVHNITKIFDGLSYKYRCEGCYYFTSSKGDFNKHLLSAKHTKMTKGDDNSIQIHKCTCGKEYRHRQGLSRHKKVCKQRIQPTKDNESVSTIIDNTTLIVELLKQNQEFKDLILEERREFQKIIMEMTRNMSGNNHNNNNLYT